MRKLPIPADAHGFALRAATRVWGAAGQPTAALGPKAALKRHRARLTWTSRAETPSGPQQERVSGDQGLFMTDGGAGRGDGDNQLTGAHDMKDVLVWATVTQNQLGRLLVDAPQEYWWMLQQI